MAEIKPFAGIVYKSKKVDISKVVTPPYDVISSSMQARFYSRDPHNIIRIILGKNGESDTAGNNRYTRAKGFLNKWIKEDILTKDTKPSLYIYTQEYLSNGKKRTRIGFIGLMKIEDPKKSGILPHEYTLDKPKEDRLNLIVKTEANTSPIFSLFQDKENKINKILKSLIKAKEPLFALESEGVLHKLWKVQNKIVINKIKAYMRKKKIFIADGHHRYEVALAYRNAMRKLKSIKKSTNYVMMYFSNLSERGNLTILSTHRVIKDIGHLNEKDIKNALKKYFYIKDFNTVEKLFEYLEGKPRNEHIFGVYAGSNKFLSFLFKKTHSISKLIESRKAHSLKKLDVTILHDLILERLLGVKSDETNIKYVRNEKDVVKLVDTGDYKAGFFLRPTRITEMKSLAEKGEMMPQKSTYFYPKLLTGLVMNKL